MDLDAHEFHLESIKRQVRGCTDLCRLKELTLLVLDLMEGQRRFVVDHFQPKLCGGGGFAWGFQLLNR